MKSQPKAGDSPRSLVHSCGDPSSTSSPAWGPQPPSYLFPDSPSPLPDSELERAPETQTKSGQLGQASLLQGKGVLLTRTQRKVGSRCSLGDVQHV